LNNPRLSYIDLLDWKLRGRLYIGFHHCVTSANP